MFVRFFALLLTLCSFSTTSQAETSIAQASACFENMLNEAKAGASFSFMMERYVSYSGLAAQAVQVQKGLLWSELSDTARLPYIEAIKAYFAKEADKVRRGVGAKDYVDLGTITLQPRQHKKVKGAIQLAGTYKTVSAQRENFGLTIVVKENNCYVYDARWRDAWLSRFISVP